jgi:hypothetical protein
MTVRGFLLHAPKKHDKRQSVAAVSNRSPTGLICKSMSNRRIIVDKIILFDFGNIPCRTKTLRDDSRQKLFVFDCVKKNCGKLCLFFPQYGIDIIKCLPFGSAKVILLFETKVENRRLLLSVTKNRIIFAVSNRNGNRLCRGATCQG